jgi:hypothetical protein
MLPYYVIHMALSKKDKSHVCTLNTAKETSDHLKNWIIGSDSIQELNFEEVNNKVDNFVCFMEILSKKCI